MDIGSRIGCAYKNCSSLDYDLICRFDSRAASVRKLVDAECHPSEEYPNLCVEQPIDYQNMKYEDFRAKMLEWNSHRWQVAVEHNVTDMCSLEYSEKAEFVATTLASNCTSTDSHWFFGLNLHIQPIELESSDPLLTTSYQFNQTGGVFPSILSPNSTKFGCSPANSSCSYAYLCVIGGHEKTDKDPFDFLEGKLCDHCVGDCIDELCTKEPPRSEPEEHTEQEEPTVEQTTSTIKNSSWKMWALGFCAISCTILSGMLIWTLATTNYDT